MLLDYFSNFRTLSYSITAAIKFRGPTKNFYGKLQTSFLTWEVDVYFSFETCWFMTFDQYIISLSRSSFSSSSLSRILETTFSINLFYKVSYAKVFVCASFTPKRRLATDERVFLQRDIRGPMATLYPGKILLCHISMYILDNSPGTKVKVLLHNLQQLLLRLV